MTTTQVQRVSQATRMPGRAAKPGHIALFLALTFALSWGFELLIARTLGHATLLRSGLAPWSMFAPGAVGLTLQLLGVLLGLVFFTLWDVVQSYAVLRSGSIWVAAFLRGLVNSIHGFGLTYLARPHDRIWSFGLGVYGLVGLAIITAVLLRDPVWTEETKGDNSSVHSGVH